MSAGFGTGLGAPSLSTAIGLAWNRLNVGLFGYYRDAGTIYLPSLAEWALSPGIVAAAGLVFLYVCENFPIFDKTWRERQWQRARFFPSFDKFSGVWYRTLAGGLRRTTMIGVLTIPLAWVLMYPAFADNPGVHESRIEPPLALDSERTTLSIDGNRGLLAVTFHHRDHQQRLEGESSCNNCHHLSMPKDHSTTCSRFHRHMKTETRIFDHSAHFIWITKQKKLEGLIPVNHSCAVCHRPVEPERRSTAVECLACHQTDMKPARPREITDDPAAPCGYQTAMHKTCIGCHRDRKERVQRPELDECANCHTPRSQKAPRISWSNIAATNKDLTAEAPRPKN
ncbi:MAG: cytochrome c3 family protein [Acidobacteriota bacterium]